MSTATAEQLEVAWPPDNKAVLAERAQRLLRLRNSSRAMEAAMVYYKTHWADFINDWMMTYDPRVDGNPHLPFVLFKRQREFVDAIYEAYKTGENLLCDKSRDSGVTNLCAGCAICIMIFEDGKKSSFGSRKEELVDDLDDPDSIFEKLRYMLKSLPVEFRPKYSDNFMKIVAKDEKGENQGVISGEAGDNIGRGGRNTMYFVDESAFLMRPEKVDKALAGNARTRIDISTANGPGNPFYKKRHSGKVEVFTFHWSDDPRKGPEWYAKQQEDLDPITLAQEVDIDYTASVEGICIPMKWINAAVNFPLEPNGIPVVGFDIADEGPDRNALSHFNNPVLLEIKDWKTGNVTENTREAHQYCRDKGAKHLHYDSIGVGAGVRGEVDNLQAGKPNQIQATGINAGGKPPRGKWDKSKTNREMFLNLKAFLWWTARRKFHRTYERVMGVKEWPDEDCISIPNDPQLKMELSQPTTTSTDKGQYKMESKVKMQTRGIASGNKAEALMMSLCPVGFNAVGTW